MRTSIFGRPRRLQADRRADQGAGTYTVNCEEPFNLARAADHLASNRHAKARWATLRTQLFNIPASDGATRGHRSGKAGQTGDTTTPPRGRMVTSTFEFTIRYSVVDQGSETSATRR